MHEHEIATDSCPVNANLEGYVPGGVVDRQINPHPCRSEVGCLSGRDYKRLYLHLMLKC